MRLRTSTRWGVGIMAAFWTAMLVFVSITLFLRASSVLSLVEHSDKQFQPATEILRTLAHYDGENFDETRKQIDATADTLRKNSRHQRTEVQTRVLEEADRWIHGETIETDGLRRAAHQLSLDAQQQITPIQSRHTVQVYVAIFMSTIPLAFALFFIRYLLVRLVNPIEEVFHYVESRPASGILPRFVPLPAVDELDTIEESIQALSRSRQKYIAARHAHVPFGDQAAVEVLLERIEDPVWVISPSGAILGANDAAIDVLASTKGLEIRQELYDMVPFFAANFDNANTDAMDVGPWWDLEIAPDNEAMICILTSDPERDL